MYVYVKVFVFANTKRSSSLQSLVHYIFIFKLGPVLVVVDRFTIAYAIGAHHHKSCEFEPHSGGVYSIQHCQ
jgi:hypothetical protein